MADKRTKLNRQHTSQPVKISRETINAILKDIAEGSTRFHAAEANGIAYTTFYYWVKQGQLYIRNGIYEPIEAFLVKALREIEQKEIKECKSAIKMSEKGHNGKQWILERVYWQHFSGNAPAVALAHDMELEKGATQHEKLQNSQQDEKGRNKRQKARQKNDGKNA